MNVYPAIDLIDGRVVRLRQGRFDAVTEYDDEPVAIARRYTEAGATVLHIVDLDGARTGSPVNIDTLRRIRTAVGTSVTIQWGGGVRKTTYFEDVINGGADRVLVGSVAVSRPEVVDEWIGRYGSARVVVAVDVRADARRDGEVSYVPAVSGWSESTALTLWNVVSRLASAGTEHFLSTDIDRDGTGVGPNVDLYRDFVSRFPDVALQASGGVKTPEHLDALRQSGVSAAVVGRALLDGALRLEDVFC